MADEDPTVTQTVRAMMERRGTTLVALALLRHYWKTASIVLASAVAFGTFLSQFHALQASNDKQAAIFESFAQRVDLRLATIEKQQAVELANWSTITTEAKIVISKTPAPPPAAPARKRR
jgi:hypothetical protein